VAAQVRTWAKQSKDTKAFHRHVLQEVTGRKGPGLKQAREAALEGCFSTRMVPTLTSDPQPAFPGDGLALSKRNVVLGFQCTESIPGIHHPVAEIPLSSTTTANIS